MIIETKSASVEITELDVEICPDRGMSVLYGGVEKDGVFHWCDEMYVAPMPATKKEEFAIRQKHELPGIKAKAIDRILYLIKSVYGVTIDENSNDV